MQSRYEEATRELLEAAAKADLPPGRPDMGGPEQNLRLLELYYRHLAPEDLTGRSPADLLGAALSHYRLAANRPQGSAALDVFTPDPDEHHWTAGGHSVVEIVTDDMTFLVDSVTMALTAADRAIHLVIHPQMLVRRDISGALLEIIDPGEATDHTGATDDSDGRDAAGSAAGTPEADGALRESWMHIEIDRVTDADSRDLIERNLANTLRDVREVVEDWDKMNVAARAIVAEVTSADLPLNPVEINETSSLLEWLADDHFTFLGYREYVLEKADDADMLRAVPGTGLGILRSDPDMSSPSRTLPTEVSAKAREQELLIITKANSRSTVHRPAYLDYIGVKSFDAAGNVVGERRFLGLFTSAAYTESLTRIPVLRDKAMQVLARSGFAPLSHNGKAMLDILETYPRDELFQTSIDELLPVVLAVLHLRERRRLRLFVRRDTYGRYLSCLVYLPRDRYTTQARERIQDILKETIGSSTLDYTARVSESVLARLHFVLRASPGTQLRDVDEQALERQLAEATRSWTDDFLAEAIDLLGEEAGAQLASTYRAGFPEAYKEDFHPSVAAADARRMEALGDDEPVSLFLYEPPDAAPGEARFKVFRRKTPLSLSHVLPVLSAMGVEVVDERPYELDRNGERAWIYDFGLRRTTPLPDGARALFQDAFLAVWSGHAESDGFSALVLDACLTWRQVSILRAYAKYFRQGGSPFSQEYIESCLLANVPIAQLLVRLFEARFDPSGYPDDDGSSTQAQQAADAIEGEITAALDQVASLDQDRILRSYLLAVKATLRTNFYQQADDGGPKNYMSLKLSPSEMPDLPEPRPQYEIFVYSPRVEGVHLRFGRVARGGLRWSDRREDFRTEILGLVKAQMVKNAVIVPVGAKGGFYCKQLPDPGMDRDAWLAEGVACYQTFIRGLLDITDNRVDTSTVAPPRVVRHDDDDSYLVVAADKGTAAFSDIANGVSQEYGFWLGDAFASGGSVGYDHKVMGITARGAWESVRRHFRERGIDCQTEDFTAVGVGDMSGDVFGNGMLLSEHTRLVAAFDHRDIFLDPAPPDEAFAERQRLFDLDRSSWADYDASLISSGGGVFSRSLKSVPVSAEAAGVLGLDSEVGHLTPAELMRAILLAPVDLLWNGGIGTYVKAATETHVEVGDKANDSIRVDGGQLRAKLVGEGGNLGLTQRGRIEYAQAGGRINTDFIDNSAGVDTSDHEVNIKILLDRLCGSGAMSQDKRNTFLASMTDEVARLVLADNYGQNLALASAEAVALPLLHVHEAWLRRLERRGLINREIEYLPDEKELRNRRTGGKALTAPELSVLLAYTKIVLASELLETSLPDDPFLRGALFGYFPSQMRQDYREAMSAHPLRREIIVTQVVNGLVNFAGITFFHRLSQETGASAEELARAHLVSRELYGADHLITRINALDNVVAAEVQTDMRLSVRTLIERASRWLVNNRRPPLDSEATLAAFGTTIEKVVRAMPEVLVGVQAAALSARREQLVGQGVPDDIAAGVAALPFAYAILEMVEVAQREGIDALEFATMHATLSERLGLSQFASKIAALPRNDRWQTVARASLRDDFYSVHAELTAQVVASTSSQDPPEERVAAWEAAARAVVDRAASTLDEIMAGDEADLARLSVGLRVIRTLQTSG